MVTLMKNLIFKVNTFLKLSVSQELAHFSSVVFIFLVVFCFFSCMLQAIVISAYGDPWQILNNQLCFFVLSAGVNPLQLQNLATLAAAAAAVQSSGSPNSTSTLSTNSGTLGALASPGK